jgi:hypothetical protein
LEQGIVTEDLATKGTTAYKTSDIDWQSLLVISKCNIQNVIKMGNFYNFKEIQRKQ